MPQLETQTLSIDSAFVGAAAVSLRRLAEDRKRVKAAAALTPAGRIAALWGARLTGYQRQIVDALAVDNVAVASCHASGKSFVAAHAALDWLYQGEDNVVLTTAPTQRQVEHVLWGEIKAAWQSKRVSLPGRMLSTELKIGPRHFALGFTAPANASDKFQGFHGSRLLVVVDEASGVSEDIYAGIDGIMAGGDCRLLLIGNPLSPEGKFYQVFRDKAPGWTTINISAFDTPNLAGRGITLGDMENDAWRDKAASLGMDFPRLCRAEWVAEYLAERRYDLDDPGIQARVLGQFPQGGPTSLFHLSLVEAAMKCDGKPVSILWHGRTKNEAVVVGQIVKIMREHPDYTLGVDVACSEAGSGGDETVIAGRPGHAVAYIDATGVGAYIASAVKEQGCNAIGVNVGVHAHKSDQFGNLKTEITYRFRELLLSGERRLPDDPMLRQELLALKSITGRNGKTYIQDKDALRSAIGRSPDRLDAVILLESEMGAGYVPAVAIGGEQSGRGQQRRSMFGGKPSRFSDPKTR